MGSKRRRWKRALGWTALACVGLAFFDYWTFPLLSGRATGNFDRGRNGLWLRYTWYFGEHSTEEVDALGRSLASDGIRYAYFHVRDVKPDGSLRYRRLDEAFALNRALKRIDPSLLRIAWIYVGNSRGRGAVDLTKPDVRRRLIGEASRLIAEGGFGGIQWDYEICSDGDPGLPALLEDSRRSLPGCWIGVAAPASYPWPLGGVSWSDAYFRKVAERCDQISAMIYDTGLYFPRAYSMLAGRQAEVLERATAGTGCTFVLGIPSYDRATISHNPRAENMGNAIDAIRKSLAAAPAERMDGIAVFADYTTDDRDWDVFRREWQRAGASGAHRPFSSVREPSRGRRP